MGKAKIVAVGAYLPEKILTNSELEKMVETSDEWITQRTGIKERHIAKVDEFTSDMGALAAKDALKNANLDASQIDVIICATITGDYSTPATACIIQNILGAKNAFAFDISAACSGFIYGLNLAEKFISQDPSKIVLVVAAEKLSSITDWQDRTTCILFGDGAGAAILKASNDESGICSSYLRSDGSLYDYLIVKAGGSKYPANLETVNNREHFLSMKGNEVFKHAVTKMCDAAEKVLDESKWTKDDLKLVFPHQANLRIIEAIRKKFDLDESKMFINLHKIGNTSASTIPIALAEASSKGFIQKNDKILLVSFGGGFTWAGMTIVW